jgi:hypothetical protein
MNIQNHHQQIVVSLDFEITDIVQLILIIRGTPGHSHLNNQKKAQDKMLKRHNIRINILTSYKIDVSAFAHIQEIVN